jgi:hypothetical protein
LTVALLSGLLELWYGVAICGIYGS